MNEKIFKLKRQFDLSLKGYTAFIDEGAIPDFHSTEALLSMWLELDDEIEEALSELLIKQLNQCVVQTEE